jgi:hypothetical protein
MCSVVEEIDESEYWLLVIEAAALNNDKTALSKLTNEANEMLKIMTKSKSTTYRKPNPRH